MRITKITEGYVDLETGEQFQTGIMVQTAIGESFVPLPAESIARIVEIWVKSQIQHQEETQHAEAVLQEEFNQIGAQVSTEELDEDSAHALREAEEEEDYEEYDGYLEDLMGRTEDTRPKPQKSMFPSLLDSGSQIEFQPEESEPDEYADPYTNAESI